MEYSVNDVVQLKEIVFGQKYGKITARSNVANLSQRIVTIVRVDEFRYGIKTDIGTMIFINDEMIESQVGTTVTEDELYNIVVDWLTDGKTRNQIHVMVDQVIDKVITERFKR